MDFSGPPLDQMLSALITDLYQRGLDKKVLLLVWGEFGRTPKISGLPEHYEKPGRDHWGAVQTLFFAGGGVKGGNVIGASDKIGGYPIASPQKPDNMAASIYSALGIPSEAAWYDELDRPHNIYHAQPIHDLT